MPKKLPHMRMQSCDYDTAAWGVEFNGAAGGPNDGSSQWPSYFTADFVCSKGAACTCQSQPQVWRHPAATGSGKMHACMPVLVSM